jgi:phenylacetate-CoA ligase
MQFSSWSETAQEYYYREFLGVEIAKVRKAVLWGSERDIFKERDIKGKATNWLTNTLFLNSFSIADEKWIEYAEAINRYKPQYIRGYAGSLYQFAKAVRKQNLKVTPPKFIISSAETLQDFMRTEIEEVLSAKVYNYYGSREVGAIAGECKGGHMHSFSFHNLLELDTNGQLLVTNLHNYSMPLIRYLIGDVGELGKGTCSCGSPLPWISTLHGRITDHFRTAEGTIVHGEYFTHLFYYRDWVAEFQVNQKEMTYIEVLIVATAKVPQKDIDEINTKIQLVMGKSCLLYTSPSPRDH